MNTSENSQQYFGQIKDYYDVLDEAESDKGGPYKKTDLGQFLPSPLFQLKIAIEYLISEKLFDPRLQMLDAGSGDGRVVALASFVHQIPTTGIEYDDDLVRLSKNHLSHFDNMGLNGKSASIIRGDFLDDSTYTTNNIRFEEFPTIFNYINNERDIAHKIFVQSPPGTKFVVLGAFPVDGYQGLNLQANLEIVTTGRNYDQITIVNREPHENSQLEPFGFHIQVYEKP